MKEYFKYEKEGEMIKCVIQCKTWTALQGVAAMLVSIATNGRNPSTDKMLELLKDVFIPVAALNIAANADDMKEEEET